MVLSRRTFRICRYCHNFLHFSFTSVAVLNECQIKCTIRSPRGSSMVIPQGNNRVRVYVQITPEEGKRHSESISQAKIQRIANEILSPYHVEWETIDWHSSYHIGQGISQRYSCENRIFIGGDACHTHSVCPPQSINQRKDSKNGRK